MKGARGLLISITGGKDLTLFEVDEAATRIREEVDQDANIIVGATFDESLDGLIRVSVVATGIEQAQFSRSAAPSAPPAASAPPAPAAPAAPESRLADLTARLRADNQRLAERAAKLEAQVSVSPVAPAPRPTQNLERDTLAAVAAAMAPDSMPAATPVQPASYGDVTVRPIAQKPSLFPEPEAPRAAQLDHVAPPETFIPQAAERVPVRAPRMPKFEDLPMPAQAEIRQANRAESEDDHPQKSRMSLLQRLANVGLGRRDEDNEPPIAARGAGPAMPQMPQLPERKPQRSVAQQVATHDPVSEYARRPAPQGLDVHGRPAPVAQAPQGDDHLDIPAFLRRQAT
jgi:cell division protein FtsZ